MNFSQFTVDNGAIRDLGELLFLTVFNDPEIERVLTISTGVYNGQKLGYIDDMGDVGKNKSGCSPTYDNINITGVEKEWALGPWQIAKHICYTELENTIAKYSLNTGTEIAYLPDTPYWNDVLVPLLQRAMVEMFWRIAWFGDTDAKNVADSGLLTTGVDKTLFTMADGLWKRLKAITATNAHQLTTIEANTTKDTSATPKVTYASQKAAIRKEGVAIGIVDDMLSDADSRIFDKEDHAIMMTNSLFKALRNDVKKLHNLQLEVEQVTSGIQLSRYDGHEIIVLDIWDRMIKKYEDNGTSLNCPHRAILTSPQNLFAGTTDKELIADLSVTFNDETRYNNIFAQSNIGTLVGEDALVQVAL
ncbi:hypothetical protein D1638_01320 [Muribaculaceae bacterium Z1]|jgi:hypothetical protein|uniref:hypothetical protein n=2 Tax=Bacteroidales TaxID=171549 RepID=UPI0013718341|nr:hypothetical protein [Duncaniella muris]NBH91238.1 hypothetical protein [Muribaculaceae bacterium S4]NBI19563.1 hypothetical protein [Muribaculaceae bacterium Z1]